MGYEIESMGRIADALERIAAAWEKQIKLQSEFGQQVQAMTDKQIEFLDNLEEKDG